MPGRNAARSCPARTCSDSRPNTASITAWVPTSINAINRTFANAPAPRRLPEVMNAAVFASLSATSSMVASQETSRSPAMNAPGIPGAAWVPRSRANNAASGASPTRRRACVNPEDEGVVPVSAPLWASSRHTER